MLRDNKSSNAGAVTGKVVLKKYGKNRRLYDTTAKRYVNLEELASMIRNGLDVQVIDSQTGEDITRVCLMQIVMEDTKEKPTGVPVELLRQLIIASDHVGREFIMWYLQSAFDTYKKVQGALESGLSEVQSAARSPLDLVRNFIQSSVQLQAPEHDAVPQAEIEELRRRIAEIESRQKPKPRSTKRKAKKASAG